MKRFAKYIILLLVCIITSCTKRDYTNVIPANCTALITVNALDFVNGNSPFSHILTPFLDSEKKELKGIDITKNIYLFETADGIFGLCAPMADAYDFDGFIKRMGSMAAIKDCTDIDGITFCTMKDSWIIGFDDNVIVIMGPVTGNDAIKAMRHRIVRMFNQEAEDGITSSQLWEHDQEINSPMRIVAQASALPEQIISTMMIGTPKGTDPSDVLIEASMDYKDKTLFLYGTACSYNPNVKQSINKLQECYNPITFDWEKMLNDSTIIGVFTNVKGQDFVSHLQNNKAINTMLMSCSAYDRIRDNNGDMALLLTLKNLTSIEDNISCRVVNIPKGNIHNEECFIVAVNLNAIKGPMSQLVSPLTNNINRIIYSIKK